MDVFNNTPLYYACSELQYETICSILTSDSELVNVNDLNILHETPLMCVILNAYKNPNLAVFCVSSLLLRGANPNLGISSCLTPLMLATLFEHSAIVYMLLDAGANPYITYKPVNTTILPKGINTLGIAAQYVTDPNILSYLLPFILVSN